MSLLAELRHGRGLTQPELVQELRDLAASRGLDELGLDYQMVSKWERGLKHPSSTYTRLLAEFYDVPVAALQAKRQHSAIDTLEELRRSADALEEASRKRVSPTVPDAADV